MRLPAPPQRIEGYDISNTQGQMAVGSMVVFEDGRSRPSHYRRFRIKTVDGANDYAMLQEVMRRRFARAKDNSAADGWAALPGLVLIDGGKGQLSAAISAMTEAGADSVPIASLAKEREEIFTTWQSRPIRLPASSPGRQLLQRVRERISPLCPGQFIPSCANIKLCPRRWTAFPASGRAAKRRCSSTSARCSVSVRRL